MRHARQNKSPINSFLQLPQPEERRRIGLELALAAACGALLMQTEGHANASYPASTHNAHVPVYNEKGVLGQGAYILPVQYNGLVALEDVNAATVKLMDFSSNATARYEFDLALKLAFAGERMYETEGKYIPSTLRNDFEIVRTGFCHRIQHSVTSQWSVRATLACKSATEIVEAKP